MPSEGFGPFFESAVMARAVSPEAWLRAMLAAESALARAQTSVGLVPEAAADAIATACKSPPAAALSAWEQAGPSGTPVVPLVEALRAAIPEDARRYLHLGATSQDIVDSAMMLIARDGLGLLDAILDGSARSCARLAQAHRESIMAGRTLLQQAVPITFGLKAAGWLDALLDVRGLAARFARERLAAQLGGAAGTLAAMGGGASAVRDAFGAELGVTVPALPWHSSRIRVAELASILGVCAGAAGKIARDILLLTQTEVAEVAEGRGGGSSAMPQKQNPVAAIAVEASVRRALALMPELFASMIGEHERAAGAWQAEWVALSDLFNAAASALEHLGDSLERLVVDSAAMRANIERGGWLIMAEAAKLALEQAGASDANVRVEAACARVRAGDGTFRDALAADREVVRRLGPEGIEAALDPGRNVGMAGEFVDRALARWAAGEGS